MLQWLALLPHNKKVLSLNPSAGAGPFWSLHVLLVSAWVLSGFSGFVLQSRDMQVRLTGNSKLPLCVSPAMNWQLIQGVPRLSPNVSWDRLQLPRDSYGISGYGQWMDE